MEHLLSPEQGRQISRLKFPQPLEETFWSDWGEKIRKPVRIISVAGLVLCALFVIATLIVATPTGTVSNLRSAGVVAPILVLSLYLTYTRIWTVINPFILWLVVIAMAASNGYSMLAMDQNSFERAIIGNWMFFSVIVIGSGLALVRSTSVAVAILLGSYLYLSFGLRPLTEPARTSNLMVIGQTVLFALAAAYVAERRARREFLLGYLLEEEKRKTEELLSNVLPEEIAHQLKSNPGILAQRHEDASVLFADIVGFTPYASSREPYEVVSFLDNVFTRFDSLLEQRGLEKIKTVGDAYMVAGGVLNHDANHLDSMAELALGMRAAASEAGAQLRIGIHCGPLVAGVIGRRKFLYDLWGETVNIASRMESHGLPDQIQLSQAAAERLEGRFICEKRGTVEVKGIGPTETYLLRGKVSGDVEAVPVRLGSSTTCQVCKSGNSGERRSR